MMTLDYLDRKLNLSHLRDKRTPLEYSCDLILGWIHGRWDAHYFN